MTQQLLVLKEVKLQLNSKAFELGQISVFDDFIQYIQQGGTNKVELYIQQVTGHQKSKGQQALIKVNTISQGYVFLFNNTLDRDSVSEAVQNGLEKVKSKQSASQVQKTPQVNHQSQQLLKSSKQKLLAENKDLQDLYTQLVEGGLIPENEFWSSRQDILKQQQVILLGQEVGLKNQILDEVGPQVDDQKKNLTFNISKEYILQLFAEKPEVKNAYEKNVPSQMSAQDFWSRYFKHINNLMQKYKIQNQLSDNQVIGIQAGNINLNYLDDEGNDRIFQKSKQDLALESQLRQHQAKTVDPTIDIAGDKYDSFSEGYGTYHKSQVDSNKNTTKQSLTANDIIESINKHAEVVLHGFNQDETNRQLKITQIQEQLNKTGILNQYQQLTQKEKQKFQEKLKHIQEREGLALEDLITPEEESYETLQIKDNQGFLSESYQDRNTLSDYSNELIVQVNKVQNDSYPQMQQNINGNVKNEKGVSLQDSNLMNQIFADQQQQNINAIVMDPQVALKVLQEVSQSFRKGSSNKGDQSSSLPQSLQQTARSITLASNELLKLAWKFLLNLQGKRAKKVGVGMDMGMGMQYDCNIHESLQKFVPQSEDKRLRDRYEKSVGELRTRLDVLINLESLGKPLKLELQILLKPTSEALEYCQKVLQDIQ